MIRFWRYLLTVLIIATTAGGCILDSIKDTDVSSDRLDDDFITESNKIVNDMQVRESYRSRTVSFTTMNFPIPA